MSGFPPPSPPDKNLSNLYKSPFSEDDSSEKEKTSTNNQASIPQQTGQTNQKSWATAKPKVPRIHSKPSQTSLNTTQSDSIAHSGGNQQQTHTQPLLTPRGGARSQQPPVGSTGNLSADQASSNQQDAATLINTLLSSASAVDISTSSSLTTTTTTTTLTASNPVNTTTRTPPADSLVANNVNQSSAKKPPKESRLKKTGKNAAISGLQGASSAKDGADLGPKQMAQFLVKAVTEDGKLIPTQNGVKTFMRASFGTVDGQSAQTCFAQFLHPIINSSKIRDIYNQMALSLVTVKRDENGNDNSLIGTVDQICSRDNLNSQTITSSTAVQELLDPIVKPLFSYLNDVGDSIANSKLPGKLLHFMIEFDRELVKWYKETLKKIDSKNLLNNEEFTALRKNAQLALLGVKGIDGYMSVEIFKQLQKMDLHSDQGPGTVLKNFNSYLSKTYSKNCNTFIDSVLSATDKDLQSIQERRKKEEKEEIEKKSKKKFEKLNNKPGTRQQQSGNAEAEMQEDGIADTGRRPSLRIETSASPRGTVFTGKSRHKLEEKNEQSMENFLDQYPSLEKFQGIISRMDEVIDTEYTRSGKSLSEEILTKIAIDSVQEEMNEAANKISVIQDPTALEKQTAIYTELKSLMGELLIATEHNPFDE